jgi:hypothetical protein
MQSLRPFLLGLLIAGCAALAFQTVPESRAEHQGGWTCYVADRFPDMEDAAKWKGSIKVAEGLNQVAAHVPSGQILVLELPVTKGWGMMGGGGGAGAPSVVCVKD